MISHERAAMIDFITTGKPRVVADYIARTPKFQQDLQRFFGPELDMSALIANLKSGKHDRVEGVRELLDEYFDARAGKMAIHNIPGTVRRVASREEAKENFKLGMHRMSRGSVAFGTVDLMAAALSAFGLTKRERQLSMALLTTTAMAGIAGDAQAAISQVDISSVLNNFNAASHSDTTEPLRIVINGGASEIEAKSDYLLSPYLVQKLEKSAESRQFMVWIVDAAEKNGLDPVLFANQLFRETMHFKHSVIYGPDVSPAGAMGFGQFMDYTGPDYGLDSKEDYFNPQKAIYAAARMMSDLTDDYDNDQILAMAAYNGGPGAVDYVEEATGDYDLTGKEWLEFMNKRYAEIGETSKSAWHVETRAYIADITGQDWNSGYRQWAVKLQGNDPIQYVQELIDNPALAAINAATPAPNNG